MDEPKKGKENSEDSFVELFSNTPAGDCLVSTSGDLYCVHDLKHKLLDSNADRVTVTLDMCRSRIKRGRKSKRRMFSVQLR